MSAQLSMAWGEASLYSMDDIPDSMISDADTIIRNDMYINGTVRLSDLVLDGLMTLETAKSLLGIALSGSWQEQEERGRIAMLLLKGTPSPEAMFECSSTHCIHPDLCPTVPSHLTANEWRKWQTNVIMTRLFQPAR